MADLSRWAGRHGRLVRRLRLRRGAHVGKLKRSRHAGAAATAFVVAAGACASPDGPTRVDRFEDVFMEVRRVVLEEPHEAPLGTIASFDVGPDGRWLVADGQELRIHGATGALAGRRGRRGSGPDELGAVLDVAAAADRHWVADAGRDRLLGFDPAGGAARMLDLPGGVATQVHTAGDRLLVRTASRTEPRFTLLDGQTGEAIARFLTEDSALVAVPYWGALIDHPAVPFAGGIAVASSLRYPLLLFSLEGDSVGAFGQAPASWRPAREPAAGEFAGARQAELLAEYVTTFSIIVRVDALSDSILVVTHGRFEMSDRPGPPIRRVQTTVDLYAADRSKLFEDLVIPGRVLRARGDSLYLLLAEPPAGWTVGVFARRR
jgi:hypothetical protein